MGSSVTLYVSIQKHRKTNAMKYIIKFIPQAT